MGRIEIKAPQSIEEVPLGQWMELQKMKDPTPFQVVGLFCEGDLRKASKTVIDQIHADLVEILNSDVARFKQIIEIDGVEFGFIPDFAKLTGGEYIDSERAALNDELHVLLSILYRPVTKKLGKRYLIEDYTEDHVNNADLFKTLNMSLVKGVLVFFSTIESKYLETTRQSSKVEMMKAVREIRTAVIGDGTKT